MKTKASLFLLIVFFIATACDPNRVLDVYQSIPSTWHKDSVVSFKIKAPDTINKYHLFVNLRNTNAYKYSNLYLIVAMEFPHGKTITDTLEYKMAEPSGKLLGTGLTDIKENKLWYKENVVFKEKGDYKVTIKHAMRENGNVKGVINLEGITDVGFRIEHPSTIKK